MTWARVVLPVPVSLDGAPQQLAGPDDLLLPDEFLQRARPHARGQRRLRVHAFLHGMLKEIRHASIVPFGGGNECLFQQDG